MNFKIIPKTLFSRISLAFFGVIFVFAALQWLLLVWFFYEGLLENEQTRLWEIAQIHADALQPLLERKASEDEINTEMYRLAKYTPGIEIYILDHEGNPLCLSNSGLFTYQQVDVEIQSPNKVPLEILHQFLGATPDRNLPLLGPNPRIDYPKETIFSAARLSTSHGEYYVYTLVWGAIRNSASRGITDYYLILGAGASSSILLLSICLIGTILFYFITRRFQRLSNSVHQIAGGDFSKRIPVKGSDEISQLSSDINFLADTIVGKIDELAETDRLRRDLIANVSHDLRSPLASIRASLDDILSQDSSLTESQMLSYLGLSDKSLHSLERLVAELFELSQLNARETPIDKMPFSIIELVEDELGPRFAPLAEKKSITLSVHSNASTACVLGDPALIERALTNLIQNAITYNRPGGTVDLLIRDREKEVCVEVKDTGIGIPEEDCRLIFKRFYRSKSRTSDETGGTGLGLAITRGIIEAHDSELFVESRQGAGTRFWFSLPKSTSNSKS